MPPNQFYVKSFFQQLFYKPLTMMNMRIRRDSSTFYYRPKTIPPETPNEIRRTNDAQSLVWIIKHGNNYVAGFVKERKNKQTGGWFIYIDTKTHTGKIFVYFFYGPSYMRRSPARKSKLNKWRWKTIRKIFNILCVFFFQILYWKRNSWAV